MKKAKSKLDRGEETDDMRPEYDFRGAVRGLHHQPMDNGFSALIQREDGTTAIEHFQLIEGAVILEPDVQVYFPDSRAVNNALRSLIALMEALPARHRRPRAKRPNSVNQTSATV